MTVPMTTPTDTAGRLAGCESSRIGDHGRDPATCRSGDARGSTPFPEIPAAGGERRDGDFPRTRLGAAAHAVLDLVGHALGRFDALVIDVQRDSRAVAAESAALYRSAVEAATGVRTTVASTPRFGRVVGEAMRVAAVYRIHQSRAGYLPDRVASARLDTLHRRSAERVHALCVELGGGVLKVGQLLSARPDLLPAPWIEVLETLQDSVPAEPFEAVRALLEAELGAPLEEVFEAFEEALLAAASLAQVHAAVLAGGRPVAVKVQRPGIADVVDVDATALAVVARTLGAQLPGVDLTTIAQEAGRALREELDFTREADSMTELRALLGGDPRVRIPEVVASHTTRRVLTMTRMAGQRLPDFLASATPTDRDALLTVLLDCFGAQVLRHGLFHADPHPGNFLVDDGVLVLLDFGCVQRIAPEARRAYASILGALLARDPRQVAEHLRAMGFAPRTGDDDALVLWAEMILEPFLEDGTLDLAGLDASEQIQRAMTLARENPIVAIPREFVMLGRVLATLGGLYLGHRPAIHLLGVILPHVQAALHAEPAMSAPGSPAA